MGVKYYFLILLLRLNHSCECSLLCRLSGAALRHGLRLEPPVAIVCSIVIAVVGGIVVTVIKRGLRVDGRRLLALRALFAIVLAIVAVVIGDGGPCQCVNQ